MASLFVLSSRSLTLWSPFFVKHLRIDTKNLDSFLTVLLRKDGLELMESSVETLVFLDSLGISALRSNDEDGKAATEILTLFGQSLEKLKPISTDQRTMMASTIQALVVAGNLAALSKISV